MIEDRPAGAPHALLLAAVVVAAMLLPTMIGDQVAAITEFISELLTPPGLLFLPVFLILIIQFLSSDSGSFVNELLSTGGPNNRHGGSSVGVALFFALVLLFLFSRISIFGGGGEDDSGE